MSTLVLEAFGELPPSPRILAEKGLEHQERSAPPASVSQVGLLLDAFDARAELMGWSCESFPKLWNTYGGGLTGPAEDPELIGWIYLESTQDLSLIVIPMLQCMDDALRRIGATDISGFQLTCYRSNPLSIDRRIGYIVSGASWFYAPAPTTTEAVIAFNSEFLGHLAITEMVSSILRRPTIPFSFDLIPSVSARHTIRPPSNTPFPGIPLTPSETGLTFSMPEWTASASGWALAVVLDLGLASAPRVEHLAVRVTRTRLSL